MSIDEQVREEPKHVLQDMEVHENWTRGFRGAENEAFYALAFDTIARELGPPGTEPVLDAGCGSGTKSIHLAKRGYGVLGLDISGSILEQAGAAVSRAGLADKLRFQRADLTQISLPSGSVSRAVCWGVLMHVPAVEKAISELARLMAPGGILIVSEGNRRSLQAIALRTLKQILGRERAQVVVAQTGNEYWEETSSGRFMTRQADVPWMIREFARHGLQLQVRRAGQFTEIFTMLPWKWARLLVHGFNNFWFRHVRWAGPAFGNLLFFRKEGATTDPAEPRREASS